MTEDCALLPGYAHRVSLTGLAPPPIHTRSLDSWVVLPAATKPGARRRSNPRRVRQFSRAVRALGTPAAGARTQARRSCHVGRQGSQCAWPRRLV